MKSLAIIFLGLISVASFSQTFNKIWFKQPAQYFKETLFPGNGTVGASAFGGIETDKIYLNDITLWSGGPVDPYMNPEAYKNIPAIREALANKNYELADKLQRKVQGKYSESYAPLGSLLLNFGNSGNAAKYNRELDIPEPSGTLAFLPATDVIVAGLASKTV